MTEVLHTNDSSFNEEVLNSELPVLVDFWAPWCAPCKAIAPLLDEVAQSYNGKIKVVKVDIEQNNQVAMKFGIRSIPSLMIFKGGNIEATQIGGVSKAQLEQFIDKNI